MFRGADCYGEGVMKDCIRADCVRRMTKENDKASLESRYRVRGIVYFQTRYNLYTGLFKMIVGVLTICHTQYT